MLSISESDIGRLEEKASQAANTLKSLSNKWRLLILCQLVKGEKSVGELLGIIDLSQSALSQHLAVLRETDLVSTRRESQSIYYSLKGDEVSTILAALYQVYCARLEAPAKSGKARRKR
jgi:ArsR family transcriptional regulator, virulence genes transcriptional regulator